MATRDGRCKSVKLALVACLQRTETRRPRQSAQAPGSGRPAVAARAARTARTTVPPDACSCFETSAPMPPVAPNTT